MHSIKITAFSCVLLFSCASYSSAPAQQPIDPDELEIPEIHLVPKKAAQDELELATKDLRYFAKESRNKDLVKKIHQVYCARLKHWADATLYNQQDRQWCNLIEKAYSNPDQLRSIFALENRQRNMHFAQTLLLRAEKEEWLQREQALQTQNQQQAAQINQLRAALQRQAPAAQPIVDVHNQTPPPPYAQ